MDHSNSGKETLEGIGNDGELKVGMEVKSDAEAYNLCNNYAFRNGFSLRKGHVRRDASGNIRQRNFVCSKEGFPVDEDLCDVKRCDRLETRTGCKALMRFTVSNGVWVISHINFEHNHELAKPEERQYLRSCRKIFEASGGVDVGRRRMKPLSYLGNDGGGDRNVEFAKKDMGKYLPREKGNMMEPGDVQSLLNYFRRKKCEDPSFFYAVQVNQLNQATNFFWRDGRLKLDYDCFGDVVSFDATFRLNKYNLICAPFVGVNHHWKNVLFGCAFLLDESTNSYVWLFESFLESMGNTQPKTIFTNENEAMSKAIDTVFMKTRHRLSTWHIVKDARRNLANQFANLEFMKYLNKCFYECHDETEFQVLWDDMINKFSLGDHLWLKKVYSLREKWCLVFNSDTFSANIDSVQRSGNIDSVFHQVSTKRLDVISFVQHFEEKTKEMHLDELEDDHFCKHAVPRLQVWSGILKHAVYVYTNKIFNFFEMELLGCMGVRIKEVCKDGEVCIYEAIEEGQQNVCKINYNLSTQDISCSCKLFERMGILCRHALKAFDFNSLTHIPVQYILKRWTKEAKKAIVVSNDKHCLSSNTVKSVQSLRLSELMHMGSNVYNIASLSDSGTKIVKEKLAEAMELLEKDEEIVNRLAHAKKMDSSPSLNAISDIWTMASLSQV